MNLLFAIFAYGFTAIVALAALALLGLVGGFLWEITSEPFYRRKRKAAPVLTVSTERVEFDKIGADTTWEGMIEFNGVDLYVWANDVDGQPDPGIVKILPKILDDLSEFEKIARAELGESLSSQHELSSISSPSVGASYDFELGFSFDEEGGWGETVFVDFKGMAVVSFGSVD